MIAVEEVIRQLSLAPHPEGGFFRETFRDSAGGERAASTAICCLLLQGEIWHFYAGAPLELSLNEDGREASRQRLGSDLAAGERPKLVAPADSWESAKSLVAWTLVGCTVEPGFEFSRFELARQGFEPRYRD